MRVANSSLTRVARSANGRRRGEFASRKRSGFKPTSWPRWRGRRISQTPPALHSAPPRLVVTASWVAVVVMERANPAIACVVRSYAAFAHREEDAIVPTAGGDRVGAQTCSHGLDPEILQVAHVEHAMPAVDVTGSPIIPDRRCHRRDRTRSHPHHRHRKQRELLAGAFLDHADVATALHHQLVARSRQTAPTAAVVEWYDPQYSALSSGVGFWTDHVNFAARLIAGAGIAVAWSRTNVLRPGRRSYPHEVAWSVRTP